MSDLEKKMFYLKPDLYKSLELLKLVTDRPLYDLANKAIEDLIEKYQDKLDKQGMHVDLRKIGRFKK